MDLSRFLLCNSAAYAVNTTSYTSSVYFGKCNGFAAMMVTNSAGNLNIHQQVSHDDATWKDPVDKNNSALGLVASGMTVATSRYIQFDPVLCNYTRFKFTECNSNATIVNARLIFQEER